MYDLSIHTSIFTNNDTRINNQSIGQKKYWALESGQLERCNKI